MRRMLPGQRGCFRPRAGRRNSIYKSVYTPVYTTQGIPLLPIVEMTMKNSQKGSVERYARLIVSLPQPLVADLQKFADVCRGGNKSGFVADALRSYMERLRKVRHTRKLREGYAASAKDSLAIAKEWEELDEEVWARLDALEEKA
jgi:hypothetical protein